MTSEGKKKSPQHTLILGALILGAVSGLAAQWLLPGGSKNEVLKWFIDNVASNVGNIFLAMIFMVVVPLLFSALALGVAEIGDVAKVGRVGIKALLVTLLLSSIAVALGLAAVNLVKPGEGIPVEVRTEIIESGKEAALKKGTVPDAPAQDPPVVGTVPKNPLLEATRALSGGLMPFMFFTLVFGLALAVVPAEKAAPVKAFLDGLFAVTLQMIEFAMKLAPIGVFCLVFQTGASLGLDIFIAVLKYALLVLAVLAIHLFGVYSIVLSVFAKRNPLVFFKQMKTVMMTAFATSSSNATLPTALKAAEEEVGLPGDISNFVLTVGATANQNGTALFEGITIIFLCQLYGVNLDLGTQAWVMLMAIIAGIGTAGVPGGAWPMIASIVKTLKVPAESIGLVLGIDRILDMSRTVLNVTGDVVIACCVAQWEGRGQVVTVPEDAQG